MKSWDYWIPRDSVRREKDKIWEKTEAGAVRSCDWSKTTPGWFRVDIFMQECLSSFLSLCPLSVCLSLCISFSHRARYYCPCNRWNSRPRPAGFSNPFIVNNSQQEWGLKKGGWGSIGRLLRGYYCFALTRIPNATRWREFQRLSQLSSSYYLLFRVSGV